MELFVIGLLVVLGSVLLVAEIALIPGLGLTGILGVGAMLASVVYAFITIGDIAGWITILIVITISVALILWAIYGKSLDNVALKKNIDSTVADESPVDIKIGDRGYATTRLALIGEAQFGDSIVEVTSSDGFIDEKEEIVVKRIAAGVIYVAKV
ncbi:MAG: nodulation efficiency protein D (NfeD) [Bacteroidales bacterium]|nr:nodulation efficiency protein D (NfeD) [Bacteroidales bacterium]